MWWEFPAVGAMAGKVFVNYRRDDDPSAAARVRDGLVAKFGRSNVFMDVDNLLAGQRFDEELAKALAACDVLIAIIGPRWIDLLKARAASGERDYVREEIAGALQRKIVVIPSRVGREGLLAPLPRPDQLPEDIQDLVLHQKQDVTHERFGRDIAELIEAITAVRRTRRPHLAVPGVLWGWVGAGVVGLLAVAYGSTHFTGVPLPRPLGPPSASTDAAIVEAGARRKAEEAERVRLAALKAEEDRQRASSEAKYKSDEHAGPETPNAKESVVPIGLAGLWHGYATTPDGAKINYDWTIEQSAEGVYGVVTLSKLDGSQKGSYRFRGSVAGTDLSFYGTEFIEPRQGTWCLAKGMLRIVNGTVLDGRWESHDVIGGCPKGSAGQIHLSRM